MANKGLIEQELRWIDQVKQDKCSWCLECLFNKYRPLVENLRQIYHLQLFDRDDWYQEALLVCYETCLIFNADRGSKFGSFYKLRLQNRIANLIRQQLAFKRRSNVAALSFEHLLDLDPDLEGWLRPAISPLYIEEIVETKRYVQQLSPVELQSLRIVLGQCSLEQAAQRSIYSTAQLQRAIGRSHGKLRLLLCG